MHQEKFQSWAKGRTGMPFVDANMRELNATGFMSNRGRQNVASFLVNDLQLNWLAGAEYMESMLVDYDVCSNYGNWAYVAGVGADPRKDRYFNVMTQALRYDPEGDFVRHWIPALREVSGEKVHYAFDLNPLKLQTLGVKIGQDYPAPVVRPKAWGVFDP
jgi:deoxyribodipyrimidine photo-lyase